MQAVLNSSIEDGLQAIESLVPGDSLLHAAMAEATISKLKLLTEGGYLSVNTEAFYQERDGSRRLEEVQAVWNSEAVQDVLTAIRLERQLKE